MKKKRTTSAEKAVVMVFIVSLPLGVGLGFALDRPTHTIEEVPVLKMIDVGYRGDEDQDSEPVSNTDEAACQDAWDATQDMLENLEGHDNAVNALGMITEDMYDIVLGNEGPTVRNLNEIRGEVEQHKGGDWARLSADQVRMDRLDATMRQCAGIPEDEG